MLFAIQAYHIDSKNTSVTHQDVQFGLGNFLMSP